MLASSFSGSKIEAGCDEAGRGCLAGPVFAAAVILPSNYKNDLLNDSKKLTKIQRDLLRKIIEKEALAWAVDLIDNETIDKINILNASIMAMHKALTRLQIKPELILVDGNRFHPFPGIRHLCIVRGDATYLSIAAASVLAKTYRDEFMENLHIQFPQYGWNRNKGYPTKTHRNAIITWGITDYHRKSFRLGKQLKIFE